MCHNLRMEGWVLARQPAPARRVREYGGATVAFLRSCEEQPTDSIPERVLRAFSGRCLFAAAFCFNCVELQSLCHKPRNGSRLSGQFIERRRIATLFVETYGVDRRM